MPQEITDALKREESSRLSKEGRWTEARAFLDTERPRLRKEEGFSKQDAIDESWRRMLAKYPPLPDEEPGDDQVDTESPSTDDELDEAVADEILARGEAQQVSWSDQIRWVYEHLAASPAKAQATAPCLGAFELWRFARTKRQVFFEKLLPRVMQAHEDAADSENDANDRFHQTVDEVLASFGIHNHTTGECPSCSAVLHVDHTERTIALASAVNSTK